MRIRPYADADFKALAAVLAANNMLSPLDLRRSLRARIGRDPECVLLAEHGKKVVGCVYLVFDPWLSTIWRLAVLPQSQGAGVGSRLLGRAESVLRRRKAQAILLLVEDKRLLGYYAARGYGYDAEYDVTPMWKLLAAGPRRRARAYLQGRETR